MRFPELAIALLCPLIIIVHLAHAQPISYAPVNSGAVLLAAQEKESKETLDEALQLLHSIPASDTNYYEAIYQLSYKHLLKEHYDSAVWWARNGALQFSSQKQRYLHLAASALDYADSAEGAKAILDPLIQEFPYAYPVKYSRVIVHKKLGKLEEAKKELIEIILMNPYHVSSHYALGEIYYQEGNMVAAMLAFQSYLVLASEGRYTSEAIKYLSNMSTVTDEVTTQAQKADFSKTPSFNIIQQVLLSKAAQNKKYQLKLSLDDPIVRQLQACNEMLQYEPDNSDFVNQYYVPFYQDIFKRGDFDVMIYDMFSSLSIESVKTWIKKNEKRRQVYTDQVNEYMGLIRTSGQLILAKRKGSLPCYLWENGAFVGVGPCNNSDLSNYYGAWKIYNEHGWLQSEGSFNTDKKKEGVWKYFHDNGILKEQTTFKNGNEEGKTEIWYDNTHPSLILSYANAVQFGEEQSYYYNGIMRNSSAYVNDEKNGIQKNYNFKGELISEVNYVKDQIHGLFKSFYSTGQIFDSLSYNNGTANGEYVKFNNKAKIIERGEMKNGLRHGLWTTWYDDGTTIREKTMYENGEITGEFTEYYDNGVLSRKGKYVKKKADGLIEDFDTDGKLYSTITMDKGKVRQINFFDKQGNSIHTANTTKDVSHIAFFNANGIKISEGPFTRDGIKSGEFTYFFPSGDISEKRAMKEGLLNGVTTGYYSNGNKKYETHYEDDELNGSNIWYHSNGTINSEGWYINDVKQQYVSIYNERGVLTNLDYYLDGDEHGYHISYFPNKQAKYKYKYQRGWIKELWQYDSTGKMLEHYKYEKGEGPFEFKYANGKVYAKGAYKHYILDGSYKQFFPDGQLMSEFTYNKSGLTGNAIWNFANGKPWVIGAYSYGNKTGRWDEYFINGRLREREMYEDNELNGPDTLFRIDGSIENAEQWKDGKREGASNYFDNKGVLMLQLNYQKGEIISYSYLDDKGALKAAIPIIKGNATVKALYPDGKESAHITIKNHQFQGTFKLLHNNGKTMVEAPYDAGYLHGTKFTYYPNGQLYGEEQYEAGSRYGKRNIYYADSKPMLTEMFYHGERHGECKYYDANGKQIYAYFYYAGIPEQNL